MPAFGPQLWTPHQKPAPSALIERAHPLAHGLIFYTIPGGAHRRDLVSGALHNSWSGAADTFNATGPYGAAAGLAYYPMTAPLYDGLSGGQFNATLFALVRVTTLSGGGGESILRVVYYTTGGGTTPNDILGIDRTGTTSQINFHYAQNSTTTLTVTTANGYYNADGLWHAFVVTRAGATVNFYLDGALFTSASITSAAFDTSHQAPGATKGVIMGWTSANSFAAGALWNRALSQAEVTTLSRAPYQFLSDPRDPVRSVYLIAKPPPASVVGAATLANDAHISVTGSVGPAAATSAYTAKIGGASVNVLAGTLSVTNEVGQRSQGSIGVWSNLGTTWQYGTRVLIYDASGVLAFAGYTTKDSVTKSPGSRQGSGYLEHSITLMDNCYRADKRRVFRTYLATSAGAIVKDLLATYLAVEGVTSTASSIATGPFITEAIWSGSKSVADALTWLAQQSGYWWQIDKAGVLWFQPYGGVPAPVIMDGTQADSMQEVSVTFGNDMYVNKQYAKGAYGEIKNQSETFHGNGVTRSFTCSYPLSSGVTVTLNGAAQSLGTKGVDNGKAFYWQSSDAVVAQDPGGTLLTSGDTLVVNYNGRYPVLAVAQNSALITAQKAREGVGSGIVESVYINTKVHTQAAAFQIASALLSHYGQDTTVLTFSTQMSGFAPGQMLTVKLSDYGLSSKQMLIAAVTIDDQGPDGFNIWYRVVAIGSPVESAQWQTYWQNLMNQTSDPTDFEDVADTSLAYVTPTSLTRTPTATVTQTIAVGAICGVSMLCGSWTCN